MNRRTFLQSTGAIAGSSLLGTTASATPESQPTIQPKSTLGKLPKQPNIVLFISDQQRATMHFPEGWEEQNLPTMTRLKANGLSFNRAYCASAMCSPSRSALFTGLYPAQTGMTQTLSFLSCDESAPDGTPCCDLSAAETELSPSFPTLASTLKTAGYRCFFKGKWHLTKPDPATPDSLVPFGFEEWDPPDAGQDTNPDNAGGGPNQNDERYVNDALNFINNYSDDAPFLLVVSLVNPHDVLGYPSDFADFDYPSYYLDGDIAPPTNNQENLANQFIEYNFDGPIGHDNLTGTLFPSYKPSAQLQFLYSELGLGPLDEPYQYYQYINFYANLIKKVDNQFGQILSAMDDRDFTDDTLVFRLADHGEHGMAHGGLRQKSFTMYEEALRVPLVVSNPRLYQGGFESDALISLVDMVPTIASLADVPNMDQYIFKGEDMSSLIEDPSSNPPQNEILFTYDDIRCGQCLNEVVFPPNRLRALFTDRYKYCRYFDGDHEVPEQREMYDLKVDPYEMENVADHNHPKFDSYETARLQMAERLLEAENTKLAPLPTETTQVIINDDSGDLSISWYAEARVNYQVQFSEDLETWYNTGDVQISPLGGELSMDVTALFNASGQSIFFRVLSV